MTARDTGNSPLTEQLQANSKRPFGFGDSRWLFSAREKAVDYLLARRGAVPLALLELMRPYPFRLRLRNARFHLWRLP